MQLAVKDQRVEVWAEHPPLAAWKCPECEHELPTYDHHDERVWRHSDNCHFLTTCIPNRQGWSAPNTAFVRWRGPGGAEVTLRPPLRTAGDRDSEVMRRGAVGGLLRLSWDEVWDRMERAVARGQKAKKPRVTATVGVDAP